MYITLDTLYHERGISPSPLVRYGLRYKLDTNVLTSYQERRVRKKQAKCKFSAFIACEKARSPRSLSVCSSSSYNINKRQPTEAYRMCSRGYLEATSGGESRPGDDGLDTTERARAREGDQEESRHRVLACVPSEY